MDEQTPADEHEQTEPARAPQAGGRTSRPGDRRARAAREAEQDEGDQGDEGDEGDEQTEADPGTDEQTPAWGHRQAPSARPPPRRRTNLPQAQRQ